jgi:chaperonin GroEL
MTAYQKIQSPAKDFRVRGEKLNNTICATLDRIANIVGATLGPGGAPVLIERQEFGLSPLVTKDGVTVFQSLGFDDPVQHTVMEAARDCAVKTVQAAGDGTTTATVLGAALVKYTQKLLTEKKVPPQKVAEGLRNIFEEKITELISANAKSASLDTEEGRNRLLSVARVSANDDDVLAQAVLACFDIVGDAGTVVICEKSGPPRYEVEKVDGYPISIGYEDAVPKYVSVFMNDRGGHRVLLNKPYFILYNGPVHDVQPLYTLMERLQNAWLNRPGTPNHNPNFPYLTSPNVVLVATQFSEAVVATLATNFMEDYIVHVVPLPTPTSAIPNAEAHFLEDLSAVTGSTVLSVLGRGFGDCFLPNQSMEDGTTISDFGQVEQFEMKRFNSTILGGMDNDGILERAAVLESMIESASSELDKRVLSEKLAILTGGLAKLWVVGGSAVELRERKDRCDDAVRAVQGALRDGVLPGGGWFFSYVIRYLNSYLSDGLLEDIKNILIRSLTDLVDLIWVNAGYDAQERASLWASTDAHPELLYNIVTKNWERIEDDIILDSVPAIKSSMRNAISIASLLGTLGGVCVFKRDLELEREESRIDTQYEKMAKDVVNQNGFGSAS